MFLQQESLLSLQANNINRPSSKMSYYQQEPTPYFVPGFEISKHIMTTHIQYYLGRHATARPFTYRGREGYLVTSPGQPITKVSKDL